ncbi:lipase [Streptomyces sp. N2-109]|uniref:Lipase n=1 Tax=Streptomyces gossypii TaxID=2883101 RepID=A0ABT2JYU0_9ACTN|nr:lipase [Streptomyces gossypii]MCT2593070.1 lipase [Streptomyces gossypii]
MRADRRSPHLRTTRRAVVGALVAGGFTAAVPTAAPAFGLSGSQRRGTGSRDGGHPRPVQLTLPRPAGPYAVGTVELHLVDERRADPWDATRRRELMVSVWYAADGTHAADAGSTGPGWRPRAPYMRPGAAELFGQGAAEVLGLPPGTIDWAGARTHARTGAHVSRRAGRTPVVLFSPGMYNARTLGTSMAGQLASEGYAVVTIDHPGEAPVEFADGRVVGPSPELQQMTDQSARWQRALDIRAADIRFVLDQLRLLTDGGNPDAGRRRLPRGLAGALDLRKVGIYGHSMGGAAAAMAMHQDRRIGAGVFLDSPMGLHWTDPDELLPVAKAGLDRPFLLMGAKLFHEDGSVEPHTHRTSASLQSLWEHSPGWKRDLSFWPAAAHNSFTDYQWLVPQLDQAFTLPEGLRAGMIGTVDPRRSMAAQRVYLTAFLDSTLRGLPRPVLDGPSPQHPDVRFIS